MYRTKRAVSKISIIETTDSIIQDIRILHDSVLIEVQRTDTIIKYVKDKSIKNSNIINSQSIQDDIRDFTKYLDMYSK